MPKRKEQYQGMKKRANNGLWMTVISYVNSKDVWIQFSDGTITHITNIQRFNNGKVAHPDDTVEMQAILRVGQRRKMLCNLEAIITEYNEEEDITVQFEDGYIAKHVRYREFLLRQIKNPNCSWEVRCKERSARLGETRRMKCGLMGKIVEYRSSRDMDVELEDGTLVAHKRYCEFQQGSIISPNIKWADRAPHKQERTGQEKRMNCGAQVRIVVYRGYNDIDVLFIAENIVVQHKSYSQFVAGTLIPPDFTRSYRGSFNELFCAEFFKDMGFSKQTSQFYKELGLGKSEFDLYNPTLKIAIEYDGQEFHQDVKRDLQKDLLAKQLGIRLYRIREPKCPIYQTTAKLYGLTSKAMGNSSLRQVLENIYYELAQNGLMLPSLPHVDIATIIAKYQSSQNLYRDREGEEVYSVHGHKMTLLKWHNFRNVDIVIEGYPEPICGRDYYQTFSRRQEPREVVKFFRELSKQQAI